MKKDIKLVVSSAGLSADSITRIGQISEVPEKAAQQLKKLGDQLACTKQHPLGVKQNKTAKKQRQLQRSLRIQASRAYAAAIALAA